ncbi:MAG: hypothetical protein HRF49_05380 [bacterium]
MGSGRFPFPLRIYADTSVYGGVFDDKFDVPSTKFFSLVDSGEIKLVNSPVVEKEISTAPQPVRNFYRDITFDAETIDSVAEAERLISAYVANKIISKKWETDAAHVALATVARCDLIASWNFRHLVNLRLIRMYNAVNLLMGYPSLEIRSPMEVIEID